MRLSESRVSQFLLAFIVIFSSTSAQDPFGDVLAHNSQIWKSFQEEMKSFEEAAHKVNNLLVGAAHPRTAVDQEVNPAQSTGDVVEPPTEEKSDDTDIATPTSNKSDTDDIDEVDPLLGQPLNPRPFNIGSLFGFFNSLPEPWWKGKNVCIEKSEKEDNKTSGERRLDKQVLFMGVGSFEHCKQTTGKYICTKVTSGPEGSRTVSTTYQCCEGFRRQADGCEKVDLKDVVEVCDSLGSKDFAALLKSQDVLRSLAEHNVTVFAPTDEAMSKRSSSQMKLSKGKKRTSRAVEEYNNIVSAVKEGPQSAVSSRDLVLAHITESLLDVDDFSNEMVVKSSLKDFPLRINIYPGREDGVMTVNCARIQSWDHLATSARVHTIDRVLEPVTQSVVDILSQPQFSQFKQYLEQEGLMEKLANISAVTVFAPNNEAWDKLGNGLKDKYSRGDACIDKVLRHHILPLTLCSAPAMEGRLTTADLDGELVRLGRDPEGQLMVNDKGRVVQSDIVATNGVVHELDKVLTPKSAKPLSELLVTSNHTTWLELLNKAGLLEDLNKQENITMFVPTEHVLADDTVKAQLEAMDADTLRQVLLYHVTQRAPTCELLNKAELKTQTGATLRVTMFNPYSMFAGVEPRAAVQCVPLGYTDGKACHVVAHEVTRLLQPPNSTVLQLLTNNPQLSFFRRIIEGTQVEKDLEEKSELFVNGFTMLAPTDEAFNKLDNLLTKKQLLSDKKLADQVVRMHLLKDTVCCASVTSVPWPFTNSVRTLDNLKLEVNRDRRNRVLFGNSVTETCDVMATDGVVHLIDSVILPESSKVKLGNVAFGSPNGKIMLFGI